MTQITADLLALNMNQVEQYVPPPNYAKIQDSRYGDYVAKYGEESWELDALDPKVIQGLVSGAVLRLRDQKLWDEMTAQQTEDKMYLESLMEVDDAD